MDNCLQKKSAQLLKKRPPHRLIASLFVFMMILTGAQAATYYWVGGANGDWTTAANWNTAADGSGTTGIPASGDNVYIQSSAIISIGSNNISVDGISLGSNGKSASFAVKLTGTTGTLTVGNHTFSENSADTGIVTYRPTAIADPSIISSLELDCNVSASKLAIHSGGNVTISSGKTATIPTVTIMAGSDATPTNLRVDGKLTSTTSITAENYSNQTITVGTTGIINAGTITGHTGTVTNNGLIVTQTAAASGLITGSGITTTAAAGSFVWTGTTGTDWSTGSNWIGGTAPSAATATIVIPNVTNKPVIDSADTVTIDSTKLTVDSGADLTVNGTLNFTGDLDLASIINTASSGTLSVSGELSNSADFSAAGLEISCGTLAATHNLSCEGLSVSGTAAFTSDLNLTLTTSGSSALSFGDAFSQSGSGNLSVTSGGAVTFANSVTTGNLNITASGNINFTGTVQTDNLTINAASHNLTFGNTASVKDITFNTTTSTASNMTVTGNWTNNGSFTASGGTVTFTTAFNDTDYSDIDGSGSNNFNNLEIQRNIRIKKNISTTGNFIAVKKADNSNMGGRNIYFGNNVTLIVGGDISLLGNSNTNSNRLRLCGLEPNSDAYHWTLNCAGSQSIQYTSIKGCTANPPLLAIDSTDLGGNTDLIFPGMTYTWQGGSGTGASRNDWNTANNWNPKSIPTAGAKVTIPAGRTYYPILTADLTMGYDASYTGSITIEAGALFNIAGQSLSLGTITNKGTLRLNGASGQSITGTMVNSGTASTIEYFDSTGTATFNSLVWDGNGNASAAGNQFQNLIISMPLTSSEQLSVAGTSKIAAGTGNTVSLNNASNLFSGHISIGDSATPTPTSAGIVTLKGSGNSGTAIYLENSILADSLILNSKVQGDSPTFDTELTINAESITTTGGQTYKKAVTIAENTSLTSTGGGITFESTAPLSNPANSLELSVPAASSLTFAAAVGNSTTPFNSLKISQAKDTNFSQAVYITTFIDTNNSGSIIFNDGGTINTSGGQIFNTSGKVKFGDTTSDIMNFGIASPYLSLTHTNGDTEINGTLNAANISLAKTSITGSINGADITCGQTTVANAELSGSVITFTDTVSGTGLTINQSTSTTFEKAVILTSFFADASSHTGSITFKKGGNIRTIGGSTPNTLNTNGVLTIGDSSVTPYPSLTIYGNITHTAGDTVIYGTLNADTITLAKLTGGEITITNSGLLTLATGDAITCSRFIQNGTGSVSLGRGITAGTGNISFAKAVTITADSTLRANSTNGGINFGDNLLSAGNSKLTLVSNEKNISIAGSVGSNSTSPFYSLEIQGNPASTSTSISTVFNNPVYISTFADTSYTGNITFKNGGTISTSGGQNFNTSGKVTFGDTAADTMNFGSASPYLSLSHTNGDTEINGTLNATDISFAKTTVTGTVNGGIIQTGITNIANSTINGASFSTGGFTSTGTSTVETTGTQNYNDTFTAADISIQGTTITFASTAQADSLTIPQATSTVFTGAVIISNFTDNTTSGDITFTAGGTITTLSDNTFKTSGILTIGNSIAATPPALTVKSDLTHEAQTNIYGTLSTPTKNITLGTTGGGDVNLNAVNVTLKNSLTPSGNVNITADTFINNSSTASISPANFNITGNLIIHNGTITINTNITASKDIIILGNTYSETDTTTGITNEYAYNNTRPTGWQSAQYTKTLPAAHNATIQVTGGKIVTAGKNFYANGTSLSGTGSWDLKLPDLTNPANGFAEAYHSVVSNCNVICTDGSSDGSKARLVTLECTEGIANSNQNVDFEDFEITSAFTERDNAIRIEFNRPVRYHSETISKLAFDDTPAGHTFTGLYSNPDCTNAISTSDSFPSYINTTNGNTYYYCYIKATAQDGAASGAWNTDATGKISGASDGKSSDRNGIHHNTKPCLDIPRALSDTPFILTDIWGKRLNNYSRRVTLGTSAEPAYGSTSSTNNVTDKTGPVLWTVRTGQELHDAYDTTTGEASQHSYDSHNFLEFRYSEPVTFNSDSIPNNAENIQVTDSFGAIQENIASSSPQTLSFAGLAKISDSILYTGSQGSANKYVNALYRNDDYSIRLSIAGWTDGTVTDYAGNEYKKWPGYIENASQFTGKAVSAISDTNTMVQDKADIPNSQIKYPVNPLVINVISDSSSLLDTPSPDTYSKWDISSPVFTPLRFSKETDWGNQDMSEAIGNTNGSGSTLDRIDFHFFDNTPAYSTSGTNADQAEWFTEIGWCNPGSDASKDNLFDSTYTYGADIIGGARQFDTDSTRRTSGGIRFSTKADIAPAFRYSTSSDDTNPAKTFQDGINHVFTTVVSQLFTGSSAPMRPATDPDGLYLGLSLSDTNLSVDTTFAFSYNESLGYLTDLAGNRLRNKTSKTIDRTPPSFDVIISPVNSKAVYIIFVKQLITDSSKIKFRDNTGNPISINENFTSLLSKCFRLISIDANGNAAVSSDNQIDSSVPAQLIENFSGNSFTCIKLTTEKEININNIENLYVQLIMPQGYPDQTSDPLTNNTNSRVTFIQDHIGNYMGMYNAHALSDFAVNYINPLYAYSSDMNDNEGPVMQGLYEEGSWAVHDWNIDQQNYGTLPANHSVAIVSDIKESKNVRIYLSAKPDEKSVSNQFNTDFGTNLRIWLPDLQDGLFRALAAVNNKNYVYADSAALDAQSHTGTFNISKETVSAWSSGSQVTFLFGLMDKDNKPFRIYNNPYYDISTDKFNLSLSIPTPLYCIRMTDNTDLSTLDLWSFKLKTITNQRGGVTILNNVIDAGKGEKTVVKVDMPDNGRLNVIVMTVDGNIITYLNRGETNAGEHYFTWNGKNKNGKAVARGMYFIRVTGSGIDETRKVMVVK